MTATTLRARYARRVVREVLFRELKAAIERNDGALYRTPQLGLYPGLSPLHLPPDLSKLQGRLGGPAAESLPPLKVCIVGAGVSGLYIAMILDDLAIPGLTYEIIESAEISGGRIKTHNFNATDYYDIGAMRFPQIPSMQRYSTCIPSRLHPC